MVTSILKYRSKKALSAFTQAREELANINKELAKSIEANKVKMEKINQKNEEFHALTRQHDKVINNITKFLED